MGYSITARGIIDTLAHTLQKPCFTHQRKQAGRSERAAKLRMTTCAELAMESSEA